jgi:hypothetical protein
MVVVMSVGMAKTIMNPITRIDHTNTGMRLSDIPGARCLRMVTMSPTAPTSAATSSSTTTTTHTSMPMLSSCSRRESGG